MQPYNRLARARAEQLGNGSPRVSRPAMEGAAPAEPERRRATVAVAVTCHAAYLPWLGGCLDSIDAQEPGADQRILVLDGCDLPQHLVGRPGWRVLQGTWGSPIPARNAALAEVKTDWLIGWDADNVMAPGMVAGYREQIATCGPDVGFLYPDLQYVDADLCPTRLLTWPEYDYWVLRWRNFVDTSSCWKVVALRGIGGHPEVDNLDDWVLALAMTRSGWVGRHSPGPATIMREHDQGRRSIAMARSRQKFLQAVWGIRTFGIVTLLAPDRQRAHERWIDWLLRADLPPLTTLHVLDNTGDSTTLSDLAAALRPTWGAPPRFRAVRYSVSGARPAADGWYPRHRHVAALYRQVLEGVSEDFVLTLEDDVEPPLDAVRRLHWHFGHACQVGAAGALYENPDQPGHGCVALDADRWRNVPEMAAVPPQGVEAGTLGGGCTLYAGWALQQALPLEVWERPEYPLGWDGRVSVRLREAGYKVLLDGAVVAKHHVHGTVATA